MAQMRSKNQELVYQAALAMFAKNGYDGFSIRQLAKNLDVSIGTIQYHIHSKDEIYAAIFKRVYEEESRMFAEHMALVTPQIRQDAVLFRKWYLDYAETLADYYFKNPDNLRIWLTRYTEKPTIFPDLEEKYSQPLYKAMYDLLVSVRDEGVIKFSDFDLETWMMGASWLLNGFLFYRNRIDYHPVNSQPDPEVFKKLHKLVVKYVYMLIPLDQSKN